MFKFIISALIFSLSSNISAQNAGRLSDRSVKEIIDNYSFIADFNTYAETREVGSEVFWRYPTKLPRPEFKLDVMLDVSDPLFKEQVPVTFGSSRVEEHINAGRVAFLKGNYEEAIEIWKAGHRRYLKKNRISKRYSYFLGLAMLSEAKRRLDKGESWDTDDMKALLYSTTTLYSKAFGLKDEIRDAKIDKFKALALYNQAVIYYKYKRYPLALGIANKALRYQQQMGNMKFRSNLRRIAAEVYINAKDYLDAIRQYDISIRQSDDPKQAALMFARAGDIYFDLNNFELAEDMYRLAIKISRTKDILSPSQYILRGESLFWMEKFKEAQLMLNYGIMSTDSPKNKDKIPDDLLAMANIRIADSSLALGNNKKARLRYFQHIEQFRTRPTVPYAKLRLACLELPFYEGNNILHARELLDKYKTMEDKLNKPAIEMAWTCDIASYAKSDRNPELIDRIRKYYERYPNSKLLKSLIEPVREIQSKEIDTLIDQKRYGEVIDLYEKTEKQLFPMLSNSRKIGLFEAYVAKFNSEKAKYFIRPYYEAISSDKDNLFFMVGYAETSSATESKNLRGNYEIIQKKFEQQYPEIENSTENRLLLKRLLASDNSNLVWINTLYMKWSIDNLSLYCTDIFSQLTENIDDPKLQDYIIKSVQFIMESRFERFVTIDPTCAQDYLAFYISNNPNLEVYNFIDQSEDLVYRQEFIPILWTFANQLLDTKNDSQGKRVLRNIVKKVDEKNKYHKFAKAKLETFNSRYNNMWE